MKYIKLFEKFEDWNTLSDEDLASARELNRIGVVSNKELTALAVLKGAQQKIFQYKGVGDLELSYTTLLTGLPDGLKVGGYLDLTGCTGLKRLPTGLKVSSSLYLTGCTSLESLPADLVVEGHLFLNGTGLESLPQDLTVDGKIYR